MAASSLLSGISAADILPPVLAGVGPGAAQHLFAVSGTLLLFAH